MAQLLLNGDTNDHTTKILDFEGDKNCMFVFSTASFTLPNFWYHRILFQNLFNVFYTRSILNLLYLFQFEHCNLYPCTNNSKGLKYDLTMNGLLNRITATFIKKEQTTTVLLSRFHSVFTFLLIVGSNS